MIKKKLEDDCINNNLFEVRKCEVCSIEMKLEISKEGSRKGLISMKHLNKRFCSRECQNKWQKEIPWEDRIGQEKAKEIRNNASLRVKGDKNPSCSPIVAKKISNSLKTYLIENPRLGEKNGFFNKKHTDEYKLSASELRKGKLSYNEEQSIKQKNNSLKKENHPNWNGGSSYGEYSPNFDKNLKEEIKLRDYYSCVLCGEINVKFHIHHIDYNKLNCHKDNLVTLCNSCHSKTNFKRDSWIGLFKLLMNKKLLKGDLK